MTAPDPQPFDRRFSAFSCGFGLAATIICAVKLQSPLWIIIGGGSVAVNAVLAFPDAAKELRLRALHFATRILRRARR